METACTAFSSLSYLDMDLQRAVDDYARAMGPTEALRKVYAEYARGAAAKKALQIRINRQAPDIELENQVISDSPFQRDVGHPGLIHAVRPAILLGSIAAFEGFAENFLASAMLLQGLTYAEVAKVVGNWNNPTLGQWSNVVQKLFFDSRRDPLDLTNFSVKIHHYPGTKNFYETRELDWAKAVEFAEGWMSARHLITHGQVSGHGSERWARPLRKDMQPASLVLKPEKDGTHAMRFRPTVGAARIYVQGARFLADQVAVQLRGSKLNWNKMSSSFKSKEPPS